MIPERILRRIVRGKVKRLVGEPVPFSYPIGDSGLTIDGWQMPIYDDDFTPQCLRLSGGRYLVVDNFYLTSFVADCVAVCFADLSDDAFAQLLRYNLKKFYAEQILACADVMIGRALLLETLLYEEHLMHMVKKQREQSKQLDAIYRASVSMTGSILILHELAHIAQDKLPDFRSEIVKSVDLPRLTDSWPAPVGGDARDFEADAMAVSTTWQKHDGGLSKEDHAKVLYLCTALLGCMNSLYESGNETAKTALKKGEKNILDNYFGEMTGAEFVVAQFPLYDARARSSVAVVSHCIRRDGLKTKLLGTRIGPLDQTLDKLYCRMDDIMGGDTTAYRAKCEMLAHAFHGHKAGMDFLRWRSKTFTFPPPQ